MSDYLSPFVELEQPIQDPATSLDAESDGHFEEDALHDHEKAEVFDQENHDAFESVESKFDRYVEDETDDADDDDAEEDDEFDDEAVFEQEIENSGGPGISGVAKPMITRGLDKPQRPEPWRSTIFGLVVHNSARGRIWKEPILAGRSPLPELLDFYNGKNGPGYVNGWGGIDAGELVQTADERVRSNGVAMGKQIRSVHSGNWERDLPDLVVQKWKDRWPGKTSPLDLLPRWPDSRKWVRPNIAYVQVECIPCANEKLGLAKPMRQGLLFTRAQHDAIAALAVDIAERHRWPAEIDWRRTTRLLGHEDLSPISRHKRRGGYDPGYLREQPWFDWDYVYEQIERRWKARSGFGISRVWGRITDAAADTATDIGGAVSGILDRGAAHIAVRQAIAGGERDENRLTNTAFFALHPERQGRKIAHSERALAREWVEIRDQVVRPALRSESEVDLAYENPDVTMLG